jgi:protein involved in ribonucleotide reduction
MDSMQIAFYSMTGNIRRFLSAAGAAEHFELYEIKESNKEDVVVRTFYISHQHLWFWTGA